MSKKIALILLVFLLLAWFNNALAFCFPLDFQYQSYSIPWHLFLIGAICMTRREANTDRLLWGLLLGLVSGLIVSRSLLLDFALYPLILLAGSFSCQDTLRKPVRFMIIPLLCLFYDLVPLAIQEMQGIFTARMDQWFFYMGIPGVLASLLCVWLLDPFMHTLLFQKKEQEMLDRHPGENL